MADDRESYIEMLKYENGRKKFIEDLYNTCAGDTTEFFVILNNIKTEATAVIDQKEMNKVWGALASAMIKYDNFCNKHPDAVTRATNFEGKAVDIVIAPHNATEDVDTITREDSINSILDTFSDSLKTLNDFVKNL